MTSIIPENPLVSVVLTTYNHESYIAQTIEGVVMQKCTFPIELIIGEDYSTDRTREICIEYAQKYPGIIKLLPSDRNLGQQQNGIRTLKSCSGKYLSLCDGDDYWTDPLKLQKQVDFLESNPDYSICFHPVQLLAKGEMKKHILGDWVAETTDIMDIARENYIPTCSVVFRNYLKEMDLSLLSVSPIGDYILYMFTARYGKIKKLSGCMAVYRIHDSNSWANQDRVVMLEKLLPVIELLFPFFSEEVVKVLKSQYVDYCLERIAYLAQSNKEEEAKLNFSKCLDYDPDKVAEYLVKNSVLHAACREKLNDYSSKDMSLKYALKNIFTLLKKRIGHLNHNK